MHILEGHEIVKTDFVRAENCSLYDSSGRRYVDLESGIWCTALGHRNPRVQRAMQAQMEQLVHLGTRYPNQIAEQAAIDVLGITGLVGGKCTFLSSGSEAVELAVQAVRQVTGKPLMLTFSNSYLAAYGSAGRKETREWCLLDWTGYEESNSGRMLDGLPFDLIGGFVLEPGGSGSGFVKFPPKTLVRSIGERIKQEGGWIVANEVTAGMGRTGRWFGHQHYEIKPDVVALGKGLGNGYPVSATAMSSDFAAKLEGSGFHHAQSHQNDPLGCAVGREVIATLRDEVWIEKGNDKGARLLERMQQLAGQYSIVKEARGRGMLLALELNPHDGFRAADAYGELLKRGFLVGYYPAGNILRLDPALTIDEEDLELFLNQLDLMLGEVA